MSGDAPGQERSAAPVDWAAVPARRPYAGIVQRRMDTRHATVVRYELEPGARYPLHAHPEEQLVHVVEGEIRFQVGRRVLHLRRGDLLHVPGEVVHGAEGGGDATAVFLNIVMPRRG